jgi:hypothetical protein
LAVALVVVEVLAEMVLMVALVVVAKEMVPGLKQGRGRLGKVITAEHLLATLVPEVAELELRVTTLVQVFQLTVESVFKPLLVAQQRITLVAAVAETITPIPHHKAALAVVETAAPTETTALTEQITLEAVVAVELTIEAEVTAALVL